MTAIEGMAPRIQSLAQSLELNTDLVDGLKVVGRLVDPYIEDLVVRCDSHNRVLAVYSKLGIRSDRATLVARRCCHWRLLLAAALNDAYVTEIRHSLHAHREFGFSHVDYLRVHKTMRDTIDSSVKSFFPTDSVSLARYRTALHKFARLDAALTIHVAAKSASPLARKSRLGDAATV